MGLSRPLISREPLVVESRTRRHSNALDRELQNHVSEVKIEVTCRSRSDQRSKLGVLMFWALGTRIIEPDGSNSGKMLSKVWLRYGMSMSDILRKLQGQGQVTKGHYVRIEIKSCDLCFMAQFRHRTRKLWLKYHFT